MSAEVNNALFQHGKHQVGASKVKYALWYITNVLFFQNPLNVFSGLKVRLLRLFGAKVGKGVVIKPNVNIKYAWKLEIGDHCWIGERVWIDNLEQVTMGRSVCLSQGALILTGSHDHKKVTFDYNGKGIVLEDGVWIGAMAIVRKGVVCQSHSILGLNSVAERKLEPFMIYKGNPAEKFRPRVISE